MLSGRQAGKKAVIVKVSDDGTKVINITQGKKIRPCLGGRLAKIPQEGDQKNGVKENPKAYNRQTVREIR